MPIRKKRETGDIEKREVEPFENDDTKHCPFCDNVIKVKAIKCQYCGEFLDIRKDGTEEEKRTSSKKGFKKSSNISESSSIKAGKVVYRGYILMFVWLGIAFLILISDESVLDTDGFNILDTIISFIPVILLMIRSNKTYGYLLKNNVKHLRFDSTGWPTWGWICPIACLYIPYQTVKDIYKTFNEKCGIIGWWWACYLICALLLRASEYDDSGFSALLGLGVLIAGYILMMKIIKNINRSLKD